MTVFRWAILGTGRAATSFVQGLRSATDAAPTVVGSRSEARAREFASASGVEHGLGSYEAAVARDDVDAVYVATPASEHLEHALLAIEAGKPVLIEKPFATSASDADAIVTAARRHRVFCMEAMWTRFLPLAVELKRVVDAGALGEPKLFSGGFCIRDEPGSNASLFRPELGGGALLQRGVYPVSWAVHLFGPVAHVESRATSHVGGVDGHVTLQLQHAGGCTSLLYASLVTQGPNDLRILGTRAQLHVDAPLYRPSTMTSIPTSTRSVSSGRGRLAAALEGHDRLRGWLERGRRVGGPLLTRGARRTTRPYAGNGYHYEADEVGARVRAGELESPVIPLDETVAVIAVLDRARASWSTS